MSKTCTTKNHDKLRANFAVALYMLDLLDLSMRAEDRLRRDAIILCKQDARYKDLHAIFDSIEREYLAIDDWLDLGK